MINEKEIYEKVRQIMEGMTCSNEEKRRLLNKMEKEYPQNIFIKTHLCDMCKTMNVELWFKLYEF